MTKKKEHNQNLKDLLKSKSLEKQDAADEFDQAALEGFSSLSNEEEAFALKNELDTEMYARVFTAEKEDSKKMYWFAAAAFVGIVGFSIYFFQSYVDVKQNKLAQQLPAEPSVKLSPETSSISPKEQSPNAPEQNVTNNKTVELQTKHLGNSEHSTLDLKDDARMMQEEAAPSPAGTNAAAAVNAGSEPAYDVNQQKKQEEPVVQNTQEDLAAAAPAEKLRTAAPKPEMKKAKESEIESIADEGTSKESDQLESIIISTAAAATCNYEGGDPAFKKELREKLQSKNLLHTFDAILFLNKKSQVVKVNLVQVNEFSFEDQQKLTEVLKSFSKFKVSGLSGNKKLMEYKVTFRP